jgi:hypothetical protein
MRNDAFPRFLACALLVALSVVATPAATPEVPKNPATIDVQVAPESTGGGGEVEVTVRIEPAPGIKINRYPKLKLRVPALDGITAGAEVAVGNDGPPPPDRLEDNYYPKGEVEPMQLRLKLDPALGPGEHEVTGKLTYAFCVAKSGFCTRTRVPVSIPVRVRAN